jgi:hypothetical protein
MDEHESHIRARLEMIRLSNEGSLSLYFLQYITTHTTGNWIQYHFDHGKLLGKLGDCLVSAYNPGLEEVGTEKQGQEHYSIYESYVTSLADTVFSPCPAGMGYRGYRGYPSTLIPYYPLCTPIQPPIHIQETIPRRFAITSRWRWAPSPSSSDKSMASSTGTSCG